MHIAGEERLLTRVLDHEKEANLHGAGGLLASASSTQSIARHFLVTASNLLSEPGAEEEGRIGTPRGPSGGLAATVRGTCGRCLIYLGDLARYKALHPSSAV